MSAIEALGNVDDFGIAVAPVDLSSAAVTGKRFSLKTYGGVQVVIIKGAASSGTDPEFTFKECTAASGGTSQAMANPPAYFYKKTAATLANTEQSVKVAASYSSGTITLTGEEGNQGIYVFDILDEDLSAGFAYVEVDSVKAGSVAQVGTVLYVGHHLKDPRDAANLAAVGA